MNGVTLAGIDIDARPGQVFATVSDALRGALGHEASLVPT